MRQLLRMIVVDGTGRITLRGRSAPYSGSGPTEGDRLLRHPVGTFKDGQPFRAIGINYFNCFLRTLEKAEDSSYDAGFATFAAAQANRAGRVYAAGYSNGGFMAERVACERPTLFAGLAMVASATSLISPPRHA